MKIVETHSVAPPSGSVAPATLALSYLDTLWLGLPIKRTLLYKLPSVSATHFVQNILPNLKQALSLSLQRFFPIAGTLVDQTDSPPFIRYEEGDSVSLVVVESEEDMEQFISNNGKMIHDEILSQLVPTLSEGGALFALQFTVFPNSGISVGITYNHVLCDGRSMAHFLRTWSSICSGVMKLEDCVPPVVDRSLVPDPGGVLKDTIMKHVALLQATFLEKLKNKPTQVERKVRAKFEITRCEIDNMKQWILAQVKVDDEKLHLSSFVLTCSLIWLSLVKSQTATGNGGTQSCYFCFVIDCCDRYEYRSVVPFTYFGNCLCLGCFASAKREDLQGECGLVVAAKAIGRAIQKKVANGPTKDAEKWLPMFLELVSSGHASVSVAGSPRLGAYGLDFGWGKPEKAEVLSVDEKTISLNESRDGLGGVEVCLVQEKSLMDAFVAIYTELKTIYCGYV